MIADQTRLCAIYAEHLILKAIRKVLDLQTTETAAEGIRANVAALPS